MEPTSIRLNYENKAYKFKFEPDFNVFLARCIEKLGLNKEEIRSVELIHNVNKIRTQEEYNNFFVLYRKREVELMLNVTKKVDSQKIFIQFVKNQINKDRLDSNKIDMDSLGVRDKGLALNKVVQEKPIVDKNRFKVSSFMKQSSFNLEEFKEIDNLNEIEGKFLMTDNQSINLNEIIRIKEVSNRFSISQGSLGIEIPRCKPGDNEKLRIFQVIQRRANCVCGKVLEDTYWSCSVCKCFYRCLDCNKEIYGNHVLKKCVLNSDIKLKKISKEIQKLGFKDLNEISEAITHSNFNYSAAVRLLLHPLI